jgi:hypothetical protein
LEKKKNGENRQKKINEKMCEDRKSKKCIEKGDRRWEG